MECLKVRKLFRIVAIKGEGAFESFGSEVPKTAQQFLTRLEEVKNKSGTEIAIFEPKKGENHLEGNYYTGMIVNEALTEVPIGMEYIELNHDYVTAKGDMNNIGELHKLLLKWSDKEGYRRNFNTYIIEAYHPLENGEEEVEIYLPIHT